MTISALPTPPGPTDDTATFNARAFALVAALADFVSDANAQAVDVNADAAAAAASAAAALASQLLAAASEAAAAASAGAALWVSGSTYALGDRVWSPVNLQVYGRIVAGAGTTDPSLDGTNWARVYAVPELLTAESYYLASL